MADRFSKEQMDAARQLNSSFGRSGNNTPARSRGGRGGGRGGGRQSTTHTSSPVVPYPSTSTHQSNRGRPATPLVRPMMNTSTRPAAGIQPASVQPPPRIAPIPTPVPVAAPASPMQERVIWEFHDQQTPTVAEPEVAPTAVPDAPTDHPTETASAAGADVVADYPTQTATVHQPQVAQAIVQSVTASEATPAVDYPTKTAVNKPQVAPAQTETVSGAAPATKVATAADVLPKPATLQTATSQDVHALEQKMNNMEPFTHPLASRFTKTDAKANTVHATTKENVPVVPARVAASLAVPGTKTYWSPSGQPDVDEAPVPPTPLNASAQTFVSSQSDNRSGASGPFRRPQRTLASSIWGTASATDNVVEKPDTPLFPLGADGPAKIIDKNGDSGMKEDYYQEHYEKTCMCNIPNYRCPYHGDKK